MRHRPPGRSTRYQSWSIGPGDITCSRQSNAIKVSNDWSGTGRASVEPSVKSMRTPLGTGALTRACWQRSMADTLISTTMIDRGRFPIARRKVSWPAPQPKSSTSFPVTCESENEAQLRDREARRQSPYTVESIVRFYGTRNIRQLSAKHRRVRISTRSLFSFSVARPNPEG